MKTDRELLELAAKAAGLDVEFMPISGANIVSGPHAGLWRPLEDDGDALRLAVKLGIGLEFVANLLVITSPKRDHEDRRDHGDDLTAATRLAITRAAAAIGEGMAQSTGSTELPEDNYYKSQAEAEEAGRAAAAIGEALP
jgi:hypothetical protein